MGQDQEECFNSPGGQGIRERPESYIETEQGEVYLKCCVSGCIFNCEFNDMADHVKQTHPEKWNQTQCVVKYVHVTQTSTGEPMQHVEDYPHCLQYKQRLCNEKAPKLLCPPECSCYAVWSPPDNKNEEHKSLPTKKIPKGPRRSRWSNAKDTETNRIYEDMDKYVFLKMIYFLVLII